MPFRGREPPSSLRNFKKITPPLDAVGISPIQTVVASMDTNGHGSALPGVRIPKSLKGLASLIGVIAKTTCLSRGSSTNVSKGSASKYSDIGESHAARHLGRSRLRSSSPMKMCGRGKRARVHQAAHSVIQRWPSRSDLRRHADVRHPRSCRSKSHLQADVSRSRRPPGSRNLKHRGVMLRAWARGLPLPNLAPFVPGTFSAESHPTSSRHQRVPQKHTSDSLQYPCSPFCRHLAQPAFHSL